MVRALDSCMDTSRRPHTGFRALLDGRKPVSGEHVVFKTTGAVLKPRSGSIPPSPVLVGLSSLLFSPVTHMDDTCVPRVVYDRLCLHVNLAYML